MKSKFFLILFILFFNESYAESLLITAKNISLDKNKNISVFENEVDTQTNRSNPVYVYGFESWAKAMTWCFFVCERLSASDTSFVFVENSGILTLDSAIFKCGNFDNHPCISVEMQRNPADDDPDIRFIM